MGTVPIFLIAVDSSGAASTGGLSIQVGPADLPPEPEVSLPPEVQVAAEADFGDVAAIDPPSRIARRDDILPIDALVDWGFMGPLAVDGATDSLYRGMLRSLDQLLQTGRANLGEQYAEAVRQFEERRLEREVQEVPEPTGDEVEAWNSAMHDWHDRHPGTAEADIGGGDGTWSIGWGLPGSGSQAPGGSMSLDALLSVANPAALPRLTGVASQPSLAEGLAILR